MKNQTTLLPLPADLPAFQDALNHLGSVPLVAYQCLEKGASKTASYRDAECPNERLDDGLAAGILRFHTLRELKGMGIEARKMRTGVWTGCLSWGSRFTTTATMCEF